MGSASWPDRGFAPVGLIDGGSSGASLLNALAAANAAGATAIELGRGTYNVSSLMALIASGIAIYGNGEGSTYVLVGDALDGQDFLTINSVLGCHVAGLTFISTTPRTGGATIKVKGVNHITATPAERTRQYTITDVNFEGQFDHVSIVDGPSSQGAWGGYIDRVDVIGPAAGGMIIDMNTPHGGQQFINNVKAYGASTGASATRALAGVRIRGCNDFELNNFNSVYAQHGLLIDPPSGQNVNAVIARGCFWDSPSVMPVKIAPAAGGTVNLLQLVANWCGVDSSIATIDALNVSGAVRNLTIQGGWLIGPQVLCKVDGTGGATGFNLIGATLTGGTKGFQALGNLSDFKVADNDMTAQAVLGAAAPTTGLDVPAGSDRYSIVNNNVRQCATPESIIPVASANRRIVNNITL